MVSWSSPRPFASALVRRAIMPLIGRLVFAAGPAAERQLLVELPAMLDRIDAWIADGLLGGAQPNVAVANPLELCRALTFAEIR